MKAQTSTHRNRAFNRTELFVIIGVVVLLIVALLLPALAAAKRKRSRLGCVNCLHQINLAIKIWEGYDDGKYPMKFAFDNDAMMKAIASGRAYVWWQIMSNELNTPKVLRCPDDAERTYATNFTTGFSDKNISYFFSLDAADTYPQMILDGDDNLTIDGVRVKPGILNLPTNHLDWSAERHYGIGNIGMADGSVQSMTSTGLNPAVIAATNGTSFSTYRWVIP